MLVQRIRCLCVVTQRVERERAQAATVLVERTGLVAEAVETVRRCACHRMTDDAGALAPFVRIRAAIGREGFPIVNAAQPEGMQRNGERKLRRRDRDFAVALCKRKIGTRKRTGVEAISAFPRYVD